MSNLKRIVKKSIQEEVFEQLKANIVSGAWKPGTQIPSEERLTNSLSVSRITIRAALHRLSALGLVESRHGEGTFVRHYTPNSHLDSLVSMIVLDRQDMKELLEIRKILEVAIAGLVAERISDSDIERLEVLNKRMAGSEEDIIDSADLDSEFHLMLADLTENSMIRKIYTLIFDIYESGMRKIKHIMGSEDAINYHGKLVEAFKQRDIRMAKKLMNEHIERTILAVEKSQKIKNDDKDDL